MVCVCCDRPVERALQQSRVAVLDQQDLPKCSALHMEVRVHIMVRACSGGCDISINHSQR